MRLSRTVQHPRAFTLIELMVSIALVVILILGVNQVFKMSSDTIGAGQTYSAIMRDNRAAQAVMEQDARQWVKDAPLFMIANREGGTGRRDMLAFPAKGMYQRQTGNGTNFSSATRSLEAWVWYGMLDSASVNAPVEALGRFALLLRDEAAIRFPPGGGAADCYVARDNGRMMSPLAGNSLDSRNNMLRNSQCDLAGITLEQLPKLVEDARIAQPNHWWVPLVFSYEARTKFERPLDSASGLTASEKLAQAAPVLLENCQQFLVEFAGDFVTQDNGGLVTDDKPDGVLDFSFESGVRNLRWYGLPRDTGGGPGMTPDGVITRGGSGMTANELVDVGPVYDMIQTFKSGASAGFERGHSTNEYICVWEQDQPKPAMVRVMIKVKDPAGRLQDPPWFEYVLGPKQDQR